MTSRVACCAACRVARDAAEMLAFWPVGRPDQRKFVCRPSSNGVCFRKTVATADAHAIGTPHDARSLFPPGGTEVQ